MTIENSKLIGKKFDFPRIEEDAFLIGGKYFGLCEIIDHAIWTDGSENVAIRFLLKGGVVWFDIKKIKKFLNK